MEERVRYDNERGKGDHRHIAGKELIYVFVSVDQLIDDFERDVQNWSSQ
jgi:sugar-specific transcriptional regulator TrmB